MICIDMAVTLTGQLSQIIDMQIHNYSNNKGSFHSKTAWNGNNIICAEYNGAYASKIGLLPSKIPINAHVIIPKKLQNGKANL